MPSRNTNRLSWVSLTLDEGYLLTAAPPDLEHGAAPLGPPAPMQLLFLGRGGVPLSHTSAQSIGARRFCTVCQNEAGQRLIEIFQENALVIANTLFQQHKRRLYTWTSPDGQY